MSTGEQPTIRDIAKRLGLSSATVSRALNDHPRISQATKDRVRMAAAEMEYVPNALARSLSARSTQTIGILIPDITNGSYFPRVVTVLSDLLADRGYTAYTYYTEDSVQRERQYLRILLSRRVDGLILVPVETESPNVEEILAFQERGIPVVAIDRFPENIQVDVVQTDNRLGAYEAVAALIRLGHRHIAYLHTLPETSVQKERFQGYARALAEAGIPLDERLVARCHSSKDEIGLAVAGMFHLANPPTAVFCRNDGTLVRVWEVLHRLGKRLPEEVSLVCFDRPPEALELMLKVTYVQQPAEKVAIHALQLLMSRIDSERARATPDRVVLAPELIWRDSCVKVKEEE